MEEGFDYRRDLQAAGPDTDGVSFCLYSACHLVVAGSAAPHEVLAQGLSGFRIGVS